MRNGRYVVCQDRLPRDKRNARTTRGNREMSFLFRRLFWLVLTAPQRASGFPSAICTLSQSSPIQVHGRKKAVSWQLFSWLSRVCLGTSSFLRTPANASSTIEVCSDPCAGDVLDCVEALHGWLEAAAADRVTAATFQAGHPRLDHAAAATQIPAATAE
jgi:hypothetical protein